MRFSIEEANRKKEYANKKAEGGGNLLDDYKDVNYIDSNLLVEKRDKEADERRKRQQERIKRLKELSEEGTLYIKGGLK